MILDNPLPASTGRVCQHPCDNRCRRQTLDAPVNMREVHRFIADSILLSDRFEAMAERVRGAQAAADGAQRGGGGRGTGGLDRGLLPGAARARGHGLRERIPKPAACCAMRIPEYRLPKRGAGARGGVDPAARREVRVRLRRWARTITLNELDEQFDAVFLSIGTWKESWVYLPGTELKGVFPALPFLEAVAKGEPAALGRRVAVIGGGNAAIDSARTARPHGRRT